MYRYTAWAKKWHNVLYANNFIKCWLFFKIFYCRNQEIICSITVTKDPTTPHMSLDYHVKCLTSHSSLPRHWPIVWSTLTKPNLWPPNSLDIKLVNYAVWGPSDGLSTSTIHNNQPPEADDRHWVGQPAAAFSWSRSRTTGQWRHWLECIVQQQGSHIKRFVEAARCESYIGQK